MKPLSSFAHGVIDYVLGVVLILAPQIFQFAEYNGAAVAVPRIIGVLTIVMALFTNYELGLFRVIPFRLHLGVDTVAGIFLAISPFLFGFYTLPYNAWLPHIFAGIAVLLVVYYTQRVVGQRAGFGTERGIHVSEEDYGDRPPRRRANQ